ncbi:restriction endonuclease subunit S [Limosilactobacillus fermentum]|nr:restriction endonuclease subunit S [Limosilactobacillus fermentum]UVZ01892.1 restriction endonuclease subunit S [Limosilactobacillus fermentum]
MRSIVSGSAQPKFNKTDFKKLLVPVPSLDEQNRIAGKLLTIDKKIRINRQLNANLVA